MNEKDKELIGGFLEQEFDAFANYLDEHEIEPSEAGVIIEKLRES